jgi:hypothetical protein
MTDTRKYIDCREFPSESNCSLKISGAENEVLMVAAMHAVATHGHTESQALRDGLRAALKDEP